MLKFSETNKTREGKAVSEMGKSFKAHQYQLGDYKNDFVSINRYFHNPKEFIKNELKMPHINSSQLQFNIKDDKHKLELTNSLTRSNFPHHIGARPARSVYHKTEILKTTFELGDPSMQGGSKEAPYATTSEHHNKATWQRQARDTYDTTKHAGYRKYPERYNIITGDNVQHERLVGACNYEFFNEAKDKRLPTHNRFEMRAQVADRRNVIDIITGRPMRLAPAQIATGTPATSILG
jgi:hypothetical protein